MHKEHFQVIYYSRCLLSKEAKSAKKKRRKKEKWLFGATNTVMQGDTAK